MILPEVKIIKRKRKELGMTQKQLSKESKVSQSLIAKIETEKAEASYKNIKRIFETLDRIDGKENKKCKDIMKTNLIFVKCHDNVEKASYLMKKKEVSQLPVFCRKNVVGSIAEATILNLINNLNKEKAYKKKIIEIMEEPFPIVSKETPIISIVPLLKTKPAVLVSAERGKIIGIITKVDII